MRAARPCRACKRIRLPIVVTTTLRSSDTVGIIWWPAPRMASSAMYAVPPPSPADAQATVMPKHRRARAGIGVRSSSLAADRSSGLGSRGLRTFPRQSHASGSSSRRHRARPCHPRPAAMRPRPVLQIHGVPKKVPQRRCSLFVTEATFVILESDSDWVGLLDSGDCKPYIYGNGEQSPPLSHPRQNKNP